MNFSSIIIIENNMVKNQWFWDKFKIFLMAKCFLVLTGMYRENFWLIEDYVPESIDFWF